MTGLDGRTVLITGAAGALGAATAGAFRAAGARLALLDIDSDALAAACGAEGPQQALLQADLMDRAAMVEAAAATIARFGGIDVLCNIAGGFHMGEPVHETPAEIWRRMIDLNAGSLLNACHAAVPHMIAGGGGRIVNVAAMAAGAGAAEMGAYAAAKSAVVRLTESMAAELATHRIAANCVLPATMDTPANRTAMPDGDPGEWTAPDAVADLILFLASPAARAVQGAAVAAAAPSAMAAARA
ncbi:SDR family NAD(P)-dependent oxidoreductase [Marinibaculum pumilum]|uniref:SDR family NAD(P)-dependent oxidoreductase n=1 Tax=Marinibaculum pumilum TaxID=1766165 RepID=A0ABV7LAA5_9PROT